ncbi:MAG TPA: outer membrane lipoprotein-sorting protein [Holophagaceae bacterium]
MRLPALLLCAASLGAQSPGVRGEEILARVDRLRHPWPAFTVELTVATEKASQRWRVAAREDGDARLDGLSDKEKGRSVLLKGDDMWLLLPGTKRPLKVTPQQRLLGPAAGGDVARTRFQEDYRVEGLAEEAFEGRPCWRLDLLARRPALSARTVRLWVARNDGAPLRAEFHLASGRLARTADFEPPVTAGDRPVLRALVLTEPDGSKATLTFSRWHPGGVDPAQFDLPAAR